MDRVWALEEATNPSVLRLHVGHQLTDRTIVTSPPAELATPLAGLRELEAVRTVDLHRYRVRVNLAPAAERERTSEHVREIIRPAWGPEAILGPDPGPRAFEAAHRPARVVAESSEMADGDELLASLFRIDGVTEVVAGDGVVLVRLGMLFGWRTAEPTIADAIATYANSARGGMP
jgi:hypothetical protein